MIKTKSLIFRDAAPIAFLLAERETLTVGPPPKWLAHGFDSWILLPDQKYV